MPRYEDPFIDSYTPHGNLPKRSELKAGKEPQLDAENERPEPQWDDDEAFGS